MSKIEKTKIYIIPDFNELGKQSSRQRYANSSFGRSSYGIGWPCERSGWSGHVYDAAQHGK